MKSKQLLQLVLILGLITLLAAQAWALRSYSQHDVAKEPSITQADINKYIAALPEAHKYEDDDAAMEAYLKKHGLTYKRYVFIMAKLPLIFQVSRGSELQNTEYMTKSMFPTADEVELLRMNRADLEAAGAEYRAGKGK